MFFGGMQMVNSEAPGSESSSMRDSSSFNTSQPSSRRRENSGSKRRNERSSRRLTRALKVDSSMRLQRGVASDMHFKTMAALYGGANSSVVSRLANLF